jgi:TolB protein
MKMLIVLSMVGALAGCAMTQESLQPDGAAELWLPDLVSTANADVRITFSPDGQRMLWGVIGSQSSPEGWQILESVRAAQGWSTPRPVAFNSSANDFDPSFAPDGSGVYFFSNRDGGFGKDDIYFAPFDAKRGTYGEAVNLGASINTTGDEWAPVVSPDGERLLFATDGRGGKGKHDLFISERQAGAWGVAANLEALNSVNEDFDATFLHDGRSIIFSSGDLEGSVALYFAPARGESYGRRKRLPKAVNATEPEAWTFGPSVAANEKGYLYFTARRANGKGRMDIYRIAYRLDP